jgi:uncharacterized protein YkwD
MLKFNYYFLQLIICLFPCILSATTFIPDSIINKCNTAKESKILSDREKKVILYVNIVRCYPKYFLDSIITPYMDSAKTKKNTMYYKTLLTDLDKAGRLKPLLFNEYFNSLTKAHAKDMGKTGKEGHDSSKGVPFEKRMPGCGENCSYGYREPLDIVFQLMLDDGVKSLGHRKNIMEPTYKEIMVSIYKHKKWKWNCVIDFM